MSLNTLIAGLTGEPAATFRLPVTEQADVVQKVLAAAGLTEDERASIASNQVPSHDEVSR